MTVLSLFLYLLFFAFPPHASSVSQNTTQYLKLPLLHRRNPLLSPSQAISSDVHRVSVLFSALRRRRNKKPPKLPVTSGASTGSGQYFVDLSLGTPPQSIRLVADTGSDLVWVACSACRNCSSHAAGSAFLARQSTSFSPHHCFDSACRLVPRPKDVPCNRTRLHSPCRYEYSYVDGSETSGIFSRETTTLNTSSGEVVKHEGFSFGCAFRISGPSVTGPSFNGAHGVMGLGREPISLPSQLGRRYGHKFSYCLRDYTLTPSPISYLLIGGDGAGKSKMKYTPLQINSLAPTFYYIGIQSISVSGVKLPVSPSVWAIDRFGNGGTVVDSGTTLTFLPEPAYRQILSAFKQRIKVPRAAKPTLGFDLCVNVSGVSRPSLPRLSFNLVGDSVFSPPPRNYFIDTPGGKCLALRPVSSPAAISVIGNLMQQGFLFEFDKDHSRLGFSRRGCALP